MITQFIQAVPAAGSLQVQGEINGYRSKILRRLARSVCWLTVLLLLVCGCAADRACCRHSSISDELVVRTSYQVTCSPPRTKVLPPDVNLDDGTSEDEAVAVALNNNSAFQATLTQLGIAQGDWIQAGLLTNPNILTFIPLSAKQWEWTLYAPIETFLLRPQRLSIAQRDYQRVANQLVQSGLTLVRDVRVAYTDLALAHEQWRLSLEGVRIREEISALTDQRLRRGDISELESLTARIDALNAKANAALLQQNVAIARSRLMQLMGVDTPDMQMEATLATPPPLRTLDVAQLIDEAQATRPDVQAARWAVEAANQRARLSRWLFCRFDFVADSNSQGEKGFEAGPGARFDIPIFNRNQGGIVRAQAEVRQAVFTRDAIRDQIAQEIRTAAAQYLQAEHNYAILSSDVVPALDAALRIAERGYVDGGAPYLLVLQTTSQYLDAKARLLDQLAALRRARAELERSVGRNLTSQPERLPEPAPLPDPEPLEEGRS
jgi:cobalt-zinc-cadmium efflux system outer membrane protein